MSTYTPAAPSRPSDPGPPTRPGPGRLPLRILAVGLALTLVVYGAFVLASLLARETRTSSATFDGVAVVELDTGFESVDVVADRDATRVDLTRRWTWSIKAPSVSARKVGDRLVVSSSCPWTPGLPCTGRVTLTVPQDVAVRGGASDGHLTVAGVTGPVDLSTADGGLELRDVTGRLRLSSKDGSIDGVGISSTDVVADTADGHVRLDFAVAPQTVRAETSDGSVEVLVPDDGTAYRVAVDVSDGSQQVRVPTDPKGTRRISVHTSDGSVTVGTTG
jgi:hypothetical protein